MRVGSRSVGEAALNLSTADISSSAAPDALRCRLLSPSVSPPVHRAKTASPIKSTTAPCFSVIGGKTASKYRLRNRASWDGGMPSASVVNRSASVARQTPYTGSLIISRRRPVLEQCLDDRVRERTCRTVDAVRRVCTAYVAVVIRDCIQDARGCLPRQAGSATATRPRRAGTEGERAQDRQRITHHVARHSAQSGRHQKKNTQRHAESRR